jgi:hypothetical protein
MMLEDVLERSSIMEYDAGMSREYADQLAFLEVMKKPMPFPINTILFVSSNTSDESIEAAQKYIADKSLSSDDVKLVKKQGMTFVIAKRDIAD